jgi:hypothetical protein
MKNSPMAMRANVTQWHTREWRERTEQRRQTKERGKKKNANANGISWMAKFGNERKFVEIGKKRSQKRGGK